MRLARYLIAAGADINIRKPKGASALYVAAHAKNIKMVRLLLENGADVNTTNSAGWTPAIIAISVGLLFLGAFMVKGGKR